MYLNKKPIICRSDFIYREAPSGGIVYNLKSGFFYYLNYYENIVLKNSDYVIDIKKILHRLSKKNIFLKEYILIKILDKFEKAGLIKYWIINNLYLQPLSSDIRDLTIQYPIIINISLTNKCNFKCKHCYANSNINEYISNITSYKIIIDRIMEEKIFSLTLTGGEVLLIKNFQKLLKYIRRKKVPILGIETNGFFIDRKKAKYLKELCDFVQISVYSIKSHIHDNMTGIKDSYNKIINAIKLLNNGKLKIIINFIFHKQNLFEIEKLESIFGEDVDYIKLTPLDVVGRAKELSSLIPTETDILNISKYIVKEKTKKLGMHLPYPEIIKETFLTNCKAGTLYAFIDYNGNVYPCERLLSYRMGNIKEQSLKEIWKNKNLVDNIRMTKSQSTGKCSQCENFFRCNGGCRAVSFYSGNGKKISDPVCELI